MSETQLSHPQYKKKLYIVSPSLFPRKRSQSHHETSGPTVGWINLEGCLLLIGASITVIQLIKRNGFGMKIFFALKIVLHCSNQIVFAKAMKANLADFLGPCSPVLNKVACCNNAFIYFLAVMTMMFQ